MTEKHQAIKERDDAMTKLPIAIKAAEYEARRDERQRMSLTCDSYKIKNCHLLNYTSLIQSFLQTGNGSVKEK